MSTREALNLARHYQDVARRSPHESRFWTARSLYYGRMSLRHWQAALQDGGGAEGR